MIRVCIDARPLASGHGRRGIGTYVAGLVAHLRPADDLRLSYLAAPPARSDDEGGDAALPSDVRRVASLGEAGCDVYHATALEGVAFSPAHATIATLYDLIPLRLPRWERRLRDPAAHLAYLRRLRSLARADRVIAISEATKRDAIAQLGLAPGRVAVVPLAVDPARAYVPSAEQAAAARRALGVEGPYFLTIASSEPHKNLPRLLEAFAAFRSRQRDGARYRLYLVGTWMGRPQRHIEGHIARLRLGDAARHLAWVSPGRMPALYAGATALAFPSLMEGFGLPVLEAMMCETPVITSDRSSLPEVAGDAAVYVDPYDVEGIAMALLALAESPERRAELIARGRERARAFRWERVVRETVAIYREAARRAPAPDSAAARPRGAEAERELR